MAKQTFSTVDAYLAAQPATARPQLEKLRAALLKALPGAAESISYNIPTYKIGGRAVLYFAGWKTHIALYPVTPELVAAHADGATFEVEKGTLRLSLGKPVPLRLVARLAKARATEAAAKKTKA